MRHRPRMAWDARRLEAYKGNESYVFVSYAHKDGLLVHEELVRLASLGFRLWYDEGVTPSYEWPDEIADALNRCSVMLVFLSTSALASANVKREIRFAIRKDKPIVPVYLEDCRLAGGLELNLADVQCLFRHRMPEDKYTAKLNAALSQYGVGSAANKLLLQRRQ